MFQSESSKERASELRTIRQEEFPGVSPFCSIQAISGLNEAHPHWGESSAFYSVYRFKILVSSRNTPSQTYPASVQFSSVAQLCPTLCDPMNRSTPGLPVHHQLPQSTQTHVHCVGDAIQSTHPLSSPSPHAPNPSQNQGLFQ